jgi:hypothetical protein
MSHAQEDEELELTLGTEQCAEIALYMYREWQKAMQPPLYVYVNFDEWLQKLIASHPTSTTNQETKEEL